MFNKIVNFRIGLCTNIGVGTTIHGRAQGWPVKKHTHFLCLRNEIHPVFSYLTSIQLSYTDYPN